MLFSGISGTLGIILWLGLFLPGLLISSLPFRTRISEGQVTFRDLLVTFLIYTVTNVGLLCCTAGMCGASARSIVLILREDDSVPAAIRPIENIFVGVLRSFFIYLLFLAGVYLSTNSPFEQPTQEQYARMAGAISVLAFVISYEPRIFRRLLESYSSIVDGGAKGNPVEK